MEIVRDFFCDSVSGSTVQLRRSPLTTPIGGCGGNIVHKLDLVTGITAATTTELGPGSFWKADCTRYRISIQRIT
jgi:hypothetical protein